MAINESWILIQGDHRNQFPDLFLKFYGYWPTGRVFQAKTREEAESFVAYEDRDKDGEMEIVQKAVFLLNSWTVIDDPELTLMDDLEGLEAISTALNCRVVAFHCLNHSSKYGFCHVHRSQVRTVITRSGKISVNEGSPLPEEAGIDQNQLNEEALFRLLAKLQIDYQAIHNVGEFQVYEIEESEAGELPSGTHGDESPAQKAGSRPHEKLDEGDFKSPEVKSPWWKFW